MKSSTTSIATVLVIVGLCLQIGAVATRGDSARYDLVVHASNSATSIDREELAELFLKKRTRWGDRRAEPVDQLPQAAVRAAFSEHVLGRSVEAIKSYWQRQIFSGRAVPPPELGSDAAVLAYVGAHPGAIGYVSTGATLPEGVRRLPVRD